MVATKQKRCSEGKKMGNEHMRIKRRISGFKAHIQAMGATVRAVRKATGLSQTAFARCMDMDQGALSKLESGQQQITLVQWLIIVDIARELEIRVQDPPWTS